MWQLDLQLANRRDYVLSRISLNIKKYELSISSGEVIGIF